jgi:opacity protein-like surface antigen
MMAAAGVAAAQDKGPQNSDLGLLLGVSHYSGHTPVGGQVNYARQLLENRHGRLYLELPVFVPLTRGSHSGTVFITPGLRYHLNLNERVAVYVSADAGIAIQAGVHRADLGLALGAGVDYRLTRRWSLRGDYRNFAEESTHGLSTTKHSSLMIGPALHF